METATKNQQGTTLEILAPYLPYGITVQIAHDDDLVERGRLTDFVHRCTCARIEYEEDGQLIQPLAPLRRCLPILRPFASLCEPLEDGAVPALEVARIVTGRTDNWRILGQLPNLIELRSDSGRFIIKHITNPEWGWHFGSVDRVCGPQQPLNPGEAYDYLRSKHFALPVNGRPLVEGVDYIPKP